jgi:hypothetical protein
MKRKSKKRLEPTARDVIKSSSFLAPMARWVTLAAAVSKPRFDEYIAAFDEWVEREFPRLHVQPGNYDELERKLSRLRLGLTRGRNESTRDFCRRVLLLRRPASDKPLEEAFRPPGRLPRTDLR